MKIDQVAIAIESPNANDFEPAQTNMAPYTIPNYIGTEDARYYPVLQPEIPGKQNWFCTCFSPSSSTGRMGFSMAVILVNGPILWLVMGALGTITSVLGLTLLLLLGLPMCLFAMYLFTWWTSSSGWSISDYFCWEIVSKQYAGFFLKVAYLFLNASVPLSPTLLSSYNASQIKDKQKLTLKKIEFGLNVVVPSGMDGQFISRSKIEEVVIGNLYRLDFRDFFWEFAFDQDPVEW